jgi:hypothetical protein
MSDEWTFIIGFMLMTFWLVALITTAVILINLNGWC